MRLCARSRLKKCCGLYEAEALACFGHALTLVLPMRRSVIDEQNRSLLECQRQFRMAADVMAGAWMTFAEVQAIAVVGSVAKALWKEIPRFSGVSACADRSLA